MLNIIKNVGSKEVIILSAIAVALSSGEAFARSNDNLSTTARGYAPYHSLSVKLKEQMGQRWYKELEEDAVLFDETDFEAEEEVEEETQEQTFLLK